MKKARAKSLGVDLLDPNDHSLIGVFNAGGSEVVVQEEINIGGIEYYLLLDVEVSDPDGNIATKTCLARKAGFE